MENKLSIIGLLGEHIDKSISPFIQQYFIRHYGLNYVYLPFQITVDRLEDALRGIRALKLRGVNITNPFKEKSLKFMDNIEDAVSKIGALNTVVFEEGKLCGYNTDWFGFQKSLQAGSGFSLEGKKAMVLGAGGAAKAVIYTLSTDGCSKITIVNRDYSRALKIKKIFENLNIEIKTLSYCDKDIQGEIEKADLLVNTTPLGSWYYSELSPIPDTINFHPDTLVYDLIYYPAITPLLKKAEQNGNRIVNGRTMLVYQAAESFHLWTGIKPEQKVVDRLLQKEMKQKYFKMF